MARAYFWLTLGRPWLGVALVLLALLLAAWQAQHFKLDASADSLILEGDEDLAYYREIRDRYGSDEFVIVTYSPKQRDLFSDAALQHLKGLRDDLAALPRVQSILSILDVPLLESPRVNFRELEQRQRKLLDPDTDREMAREEFRTSALYRNLIMSADGDTTALVATLQPDAEAGSLLDRREALRIQRDREGLSEAEAEELARVEAAYDERKAVVQARLQQDIAAIREVLAAYRDHATIHLGGLPMMASDMIDYVRDDITTFGIGVGLFILVLLGVSFRRLRWVVVPSLICGAVSLLTVGFLGAVDWRVTLVSSNFISLLLILSLSLVIHLVVRHRELHQQQPEQEQAELLRATIRSKLVPSVFTVLTTVVAFASLAVADIRPVIDFGLMMTVGVGIAFVASFLMFPMLLARLRPGAAPATTQDVTARVNRQLAALSGRTPLGVLVAFVAIVAVAALGISRLTVENRFIDYFHESTDIYQGLIVIDRELGGTTPLDVIIDAPQSFFEELAWQQEEGLPQLGGGGLTAESYWYNSYRLGEVEQIHDYLDAQAETGKVLSMATTMRMMTILNDGNWPGDFALALIYRLVPEDLKKTLFDPYMSEDGNQVRFAVRIIDSDPDLRRDAFLKRIRSDIIEQFEIEPGQLHLTGAMVLYNNVMQSLFRSQAATLGLVFFLIFGMFWLLFRSLRMALVGVAPTLVAALAVLGLLGWMGIPLDVMTITIAAITIGIGVHDTIHYTYRFRDEVAEGGYDGAVMRSHASVGRAMFYTTLVITLGFSILMLSNFVPTIYFGLFTGVAMVFALLANLTLLPVLLMRLRPFPEG